MSTKIFNIALLMTLLNVKTSSSLECYVCEQQEDNEGKCISTVNTCDYKQDRCLSVIKWGSSPLWDIGVPMTYYISKQCANEDLCQRAFNGSIGLCHRIHWKDWQCAECCQGDRCNYYITLGSSSIQASMMAAVLSVLLTFLFK